MRSFDICFSVSSLFQLEWVLKNWCFCTVVLESPLDCREIKPVNPKGNKTWIFIGRTDVEAETNTFATWCKKPTHWKRPWCWERLRARGEGDDRGWDGWMASPTQRTWVWVNSGSWWWTGRPGVLQSMGLQTVGHDWVTEPQQRSKIKLTWIFCQTRLFWGERNEDTLIQRLFLAELRPNCLL